MLWTTDCLACCTWQKVSLISIISWQTQREHPCLFEGEHPKLQSQQCCSDNQKHSWPLPSPSGVTLPHEWGMAITELKRVLLICKTPAGLHLPEPSWVIFLCCPHLTGSGGLSLTQSPCPVQDLGQPLLPSTCGHCCTAWLSLLCREPRAGGGTAGCKHNCWLWKLSRVVMYLKKKKKILPFVWWYWTLSCCNWVRPTQTSVDRSVSKLFWNPVN